MATPTFDPNAAFEEYAEAAPATTSGPTFDPNAPFEEVGETSKPTPAPKAPEKIDGTVDRFVTNFQSAAQKGFGGQAAQYLSYYTGQAHKLLKERFPDQKEEWYDDQAWKLISNSRRDLIEGYDARLATDESPDDNVLEWAAKGATGLLGGLFGSADPTMALAPGGSALARIGSQGAISGAADAAYQGLNVREGVSDELDWGSVGLNALFGAGMQGGFEGAGKLASKLRTTKLDPEVEATLSSMYDTASYDEIMKYAEENGAMVNPDEVRAYVDYRIAHPDVQMDTAIRYKNVNDQTAPVEPEQTSMDFNFEPRQKELDFDRPTLEQSLSEEAAAFKRSQPQDPTPEQLFPPKEEQLSLDVDTPQQPSFNFDEPAFDTFGKQVEVARQEAQPHLDTINQKVAEVTDGWSNAPRFEVVNSIDDIADEAVRASMKGNEGKKAFVGEDGIVRIIGKNVQPHEVAPIVFHEALGHQGMSNQFRADLDDKLTEIMDTTPWFRNKVKHAMEKNKDYINDPNPSIRIADELFAKMSEDGVIKDNMVRKVYDKVVDTIKDYARKAGIKMEFSPREIRSILRQAHETVTAGTETYTGTGSRFYNEEMRSLDGSKIKTTEDIDDVMEFLGGNSEHLNDGSVSIKDILREAEDLGLTPSKYLKSQSLTDQKLRARVAGAKQVLADQVQELLTMKAKMDKKGMTPTLLMDLQERIATATAVFARFGNDTAELARSLRLLREVTESRKLGKEMARFMEGEGLDGHLASEESVIRFLNKLEEANKVSPTEAAKVLNSKEAATVKDRFNDVLNLPRALMSTADLSAPFRQGIFLVGKKDFWKGIPQMLKMYGSAKHHQFIMDSIMNSPNFPLMQKSGLAISGGHKLSAKEEAFMSNIAENMPGNNPLSKGWNATIGRTVRASERAYTGFLNKLRADSFNNLVNQYEKAGIDLSHKDNRKSLTDAARFVNAATGRGNMGGYAMGPKLNAMFFSPRLMASRVQLLNPKFYYDLDPIVRKEALKNLAAFGTIATSVLSMAALNGAEVETDPRSSDFAKIKVGNTRYDMLGGFGQYLTLGARVAPLLIGERGSKKKGNGDIVKYGEGFKADTEFDAVMDFTTNKASPIASWVIGYMKGKDPTGKPFDLTSEAASRFVPLILQDFAEIAKEEGIESTPKVLPSVVGFGAQTYDSGPKRKYDQIGNEIEKGETSPVNAVLDSLKEEGKELVSHAPKSVKIAGEKIDLVGENYDQFQKISGDYFRTEMEAIIQMEEFNSLDDEGKREIIKDLLRESRAVAKEELFGLAEDAE